MFDKILVLISVFIYPMSADTWTFECSVLGTGFTVWNGSAFHCPSSNNKIIFFHTGYSSTSGIEDYCNNKDIMIFGESVGVIDNIYTSRITVTSSSDLTGKSIECRYDNGMTNRRVMSFMKSNGSEPAIVTGVQNEQPTISSTDVGRVNSVSVGTILAILFGIIISIIGAILVILVGYMLKQKKQNDSCTGLNMRSSTAPEQDFSHPQDSLAAANAVELIVTEKNYSYVDVRRNLHLKTSNNSRSRDFTSKAATIRAEDEYLNLDSLLVKLCGKVTNKWYELGMAVHVPQVFLNKIKGYPNEECVIKVLDYWLKIHPDQPTWKEMADALEDIQEYELASSIKGIYKQDAPHTTG